MKTNIPCCLFPAFVWSMIAAAASCQEVRSLPWIEGSTTLAVLPDTERYSDDYPQYFEAQTRWLEFLPDGRTIQVRTYSPALEKSRKSKLEEFRFTLGFADRNIDGNSAR